MPESYLALELSSSTSIWFVRKLLCDFSVEIVLSSVAYCCAEHRLVRGDVQLHRRDLVVDELDARLVVVLRRRDVAGDGSVAFEIAVCTRCASPGVYVKLPRSPVAPPVILIASPLIVRVGERHQELLAAAGRGDAVDRALHVLAGVGRRSRSPSQSTSKLAAWPYWFVAICTPCRCRSPGARSPRSRTPRSGRSRRRLACRRPSPRTRPRCVPTRTFTVGSDAGRPGAVEPDVAGLRRGLRDVDVVRAADRAVAGRDERARCGCRTSRPARTAWRRPAGRRRTRRGTWCGRR